MNTTFTVLNRTARLGLAFLVLLTALLTGTTPARAAGLTVNTLDDELNVDGDCSLSEAIQAANTDTAVDGCPAGSGADTITFSVSGTITPERFLIESDLTIDGSGQSITLNAVNARTVLIVRDGFTVNINTLNITGAGGALITGAIVNEGTLMVSNSTFFGNSATVGAGIINGGMLMVSNSTFFDNSAGTGGSIANANVGTLTVINSTFSGNKAQEGGAITNFGTLTVINSTLSGNSAQSGGAIYNREGGTLHLSNTILANSSSGGDCVSLGTLATNVNNLIEDGSCSPAISGDPVLGPLQDNGGTTHTMALGAGSPAADAAEDSACPATDQRGATRPQGPHCDIGAFEAQFNYPFSGFFSPVDNLGVFNTVKAGQAIPVKFSLGGNQGLNIFAASYPKVQEVACDSSAPGDKIEETVTSGNSGLQYDPATGIYTYIWKTQKSWTSTCRQLIVRLTDGTEHAANFMFK